MQQFIDPLPEAYAYFKSLPRDTPIHMLNLARYRPVAEYPADHPQAGAQWTGRQAYEEYGRLSAPILRRIGGHIVWRGAFEAAVIGEPGQIWDDAFIAAYPSTESFFGLIKDPNFPTAWAHRTAGILDYRLIRFAPREPGEGFAGI